MNNLHIYC